MNEYTTEFLLAAMGLASVIFGKWQSGKLSSLSHQVQSLNERILKLEADVTHRDGIIAALRSEIKTYQTRVENLLREISKGSDHGVF